MIEVEKKFTLKEEDIERIIQGVEFVNERSFTDTYFDTSDYSLTRADKWLRLRDDRFELKLPMNAGKGASQRKLDQYEELETEEAIRKALGLATNGSLREDLEANGYKTFSTFTTTRKKYKKGDFIIDLDVMDFGYSIGEIELMVSEQSEMEDALNKILAFAKEQGLSVAPVRGKVIEYIKRNNLEHYKALEEAGVL
jgi:predicted adenylyl cyclase CyaB